MSHGLHTALILIQFFLRVVHADMARDPTTFCAEPLPRNWIPSEILVFHLSTRSGWGCVDQR